MLNFPKILKILLVTLSLFSFSSCLYMNKGGLKEDEQTATPKLPFVSVWQTSTPDEVITLPLVSGFNYDIQVDWGDGSEISEITSWNDPLIDHTYALAGFYTITISGLAEAWSFNNAGSKNKIISVTELGDLGWISFAGAFLGCANLTTVAGGNTSQVTNMSLMFSSAVKATPDTSNWDTGNVTTMAQMFRGATLANPDVSRWNTSKVTDMGSMFRFTSANPNVANWDTSSVLYMNEMFIYNGTANPDVSRWDTSSVLSTFGMFRDAPSAYPDVSAWDLSSATNIQQMFLRTNSNPDVSAWDTSSIVNMGNLFQEAPNANPDMSGWSFVSVTNMAYMFHLTSSLSTHNYSELLKRINATSPANNMGLHVNTAKYNASAVAARSNLVSRGWVFSDGGAE